MKTHFVTTIRLHLVAAALTCSANTLAAGGWLTENGGADTGMAGAGRAALVLDAASQVANPASLALLPRSSVTLAVIPLSIDTRIDGSGSTQGTADDRSGMQYIGGLYGAHVEGRIAYGLAAYGYLGLGFDLGDDWAGRRAMERASLMTFNLAPAIAYQVNDELTVGASVAMQWSGYDFALSTASDAALLGPPADLPDGRLSIDGESWQAGGQLGVLYRPRGDLGLGLAWTAPVDHSAGVDLHLHSLHPTLAALLPDENQLGLEYTIPQQLAFGLTYSLPDRRLFSLGLTWQDWSALGNARFELPGQTVDVFERQLDDAWGVTLGVRQRIDSRWTLSAGVGYESDPAPKAGVAVFFPVTQQWRFAAGAEHVLRDDLKLRLMLSVLAQGSARIVQSAPPLPLPGIPEVSGKYEPSRMVMLGIGLDFGGSAR